MEKPTKYPFNLLGEDAVLFAKLKSISEDRIGLQLATIDVIRLAMQALAEKQGIK